ncbi:MAG: glycoside hydrolase family protein [Zoogloeaceae bacterium]|jgi:lysozyme|nr:glycoside hydrolase family protein [Zoogloeaceae bacterium]
MSNGNVARALVATLSLSAVGLTGIVAWEGYTNEAIRPVKGDVPTYGFGSTVKADGAPVSMGDRITPPAALALAARDIAIKEGALKTCMGDVPLSQNEYDAIVSLAYNVGPAAVCKSSLPGKFRAGDNKAGCKTILDFKKVQGRDCSLPENKRFCGGVWTRRQAEYRLCVSEDREQRTEDSSS